MTEYRYSKPAPNSTAFDAVEHGGMWRSSKNARLYLRIKTLAGGANAVLMISGDIVTVDYNESGRLVVKADLTLEGDKT